MRWIGGSILLMGSVCVYANDDAPNTDILEFLGMVSTLETTGVDVEVLIAASTEQEEEKDEKQHD